MKKMMMGTALALSLAVSTTTAMATGYVQPAVPAPVIVEDTAASNQGIFVPIFAIALLLLLHHGGSSFDPLVGASDERLKTDIVRIGATDEGIGIYEWRYIGGDQRYRGVMAQDVVQFRPDAVYDLGGGYLGVNYEALGMEMVAID